MKGSDLDIAVEALFKVANSLFADIGIQTITKNARADKYRYHAQQSENTDSDECLPSGDDQTNPAQ
jgi:hypothetical protein